MRAASKPQRVVFLDLLRALAVVMMVQGHTIDLLLANEYRSYDFLSFRLWQFVRGVTAPIFLLTAGTVFIYLLRSNAAPLRDNSRLAKGIKRALLLLALGYLLRFPSPSIIGVFTMPSEYWLAFWVVDVLQLIGVALLLLLLGAFLAEKSRFNDYAVFACGGLFFFLGSIFCEQIAWEAWLPAPLAAYFYSGSGSHFPLFPWAGYVMCGGVLGAYLARAGQPPAPLSLSRRLTLAGMSLLALYYCGGWLIAARYGSSLFLASNPDLILLRLGSVLLLVALIARLSARVRAVPHTLLLIGRQTLLIYVAHLVILYGSPWNSGLDRLCDKCLAVWPALLVALLMQAAMIGLAVAWSKIGFGRYWNNLPARRLTDALWLRKRSAQRLQHLAGAKKIN
jgi:uncharacterized membrane protein